MTKGGRKRGSRDKKPRRVQNASLQNLVPVEPLPAGHDSAVCRVSGPRGAVGWWASLTAAERGRVVAAVQSHGVPVEHEPDDWAE